jgi:hypothetical protein
VTYGKLWFRFVPLLLAGTLFSAVAQIDPEIRHHFQVGYNQPLTGKGPIAGYAFYYRNDPGFLRTNWTLRLAVAPVYVDSELGIHQALGPNTDLGLGLAGGGFADTYSEVRRGRFIEEESFTGHGGEVSASAYHHFNPAQMIPLYGIVRAAGHYTVFSRDSDTHRDFVIPPNRMNYAFRAGLRWGGSEPFMQPALGMEISTWYELRLRSESGPYGFGGNYKVEPHSHLFWSRALLIYTFPEFGHNLSLNLTGGTTIDADRFSAFRLGGSLPLIAEFPLSIPGYYFQEISAKDVVVLNVQYTLPLDSRNRWQIIPNGAIARVNYLPGLEQPRRTHAGAGIGLGYRSRYDMWRVVLGYGYGFTAMRRDDRGGHNIGIVCEFDLEARYRLRYPELDLNKSRGLFQLFGL